jgi:hypothetical protein
VLGFLQFYKLQSPALSFIKRSRDAKDRPDTQASGTESRNLPGTQETLGKNNLVGAITLIYGGLLRKRGSRHKLYPALPKT